MRLLVLLVLLPFAAVSQVPSQKKIIIITNKDTTILESDLDQLDSLIEWNMKSIYRMGNALGEFPSEFQVEVFIDSVFKEVETAKGFKEKNHEGNSYETVKTVRLELKSILIKRKTIRTQQLRRRSSLKKVQK